MKSNDHKRTFLIIFRGLRVLGITVPSFLLDIVPTVRLAHLQIVRAAEELLEQNEVPFLGI